MRPTGLENHLENHMESCDRRKIEEGTCKLMGLANSCSKSDSENNVHGGNLRLRVKQRESVRTVHSQLKIFATTAIVVKVDDSLKWMDRHDVRLQDRSPISEVFTITEVN